ncbi:MAG: single-stranded-DNA-specific exonuclease RecJ [Alphaproteobacteria bacterium]
MASTTARPLPRACFLDVERSVSGRRWEERLADPRQGLALAQRLDVPEVVGRMMAARGIGLDDAAAYLEPTLREALPDPLCLKDMDAAVARLTRAVTTGEAIAIFGDYDVDGATSSALLHRFLRAVGAEPRVYIPDRIAEGYGPNERALLELRRQGAAVAVTVDCGIAAFAPLDAAADAGLDVVVLDHHTAQPALPKAVAIVNPNRLDEVDPKDDRHGLRCLAAVGVTFLLVVALNRALREAGWYNRDGQAEPDVRQWLDLVALGTVCDVVPLTGLNRALVAQGLKIMASRGNAGLAALADVAGLKERPEAYHAGFILGPRVNAGGRVGEAPLGARLLATDDAGEAAAMAHRLNEYNTERRAIEARVLEEAISRAEEDNAAPGGPVFVIGEGWHPGVVGIIASRLRERFAAPAMVIAIDTGTGVGRGSGRSVPGVDLGAAVIAAQQEGLLVNGGGHPMAAGLTVRPERLTDLRDFLDKRLRAALDTANYRPALGLDGALQPGAATAELVRQLDRCGPFGTGNVQPRFAIPAVRVVHANVVGENHVRCILAGSSGQRLKGIAFRALDTEMGKLLLQSGGRPIHLAGKLRPDDWAGRDAVQLIIEDAAVIPSNTKSH